VEHVFSAWHEVVARLQSAGSILLLCDFDGTLTPIVARPELAYLSEETKKALQSVAARERYTVGLISGRALNDLKDRVGLQGIVYAGNYGMELETPWLKLVYPAAGQSQPLMHALCRQLRSALSGIQGAFVEDKGLTFSIHYRLVKREQTDELRNVLERVTGNALAEGRIQVSTGKKVYEVTPAISWHKGKAIDLLLEHQSKAGGQGSVLPLFLGDDVSDEEGFKTAETRGGISVFVGERRPQPIAQYYLRSPKEVRQFLERLP
jgi:trehalose 6-phosphate phosphatase